MHLPYGPGDVLVPGTGRQIKHFVSRGLVSNRQLLSTDANAAYGSKTGEAPSAGGWEGRLKAEMGGAWHEDRNFDGAKDGR